MVKANEKTADSRDARRGATVDGFVQSGTAESMAPGKTGSDTTGMTEEERDQVASKLVRRFSLWSGAAGLIPIPLVDMAAVGGVQLQMLRRLSVIYGVPFSENRGKSIIASLAGAVIPASIATTTAVGVGSLVKSFPGIGTAIGALTMPVFSAGATYVIGKVFIKHFASGGTLFVFNPPDYRQFIKAQKERFAARSAAPSSGSSASATRSASKPQIKERDIPTLDFGKRPSGWLGHWSARYEKVLARTINLYPPFSQTQSELLSGVPHPLQETLDPLASVAEPMDRDGKLIAWRLTRSAAFDLLGPIGIVVGTLALAIAALSVALPLLELPPLMTPTQELPTQELQPPKAPSPATKQQQQQQQQQQK
jgi:uncharacterized protein (DUF697 family)